MPGQRKTEMRKDFRAIRTEIPAELRQRVDKVIERNVLALPEYAAADVLLPYLAFGAEVETRGIIRAAWEGGKAVALPWCVPGTRDMRWFRVTDFADLVRSALGVDEPRPDTTNELAVGTGERMLALVPGLTFDPHGFRLGYGGGFYDSFLAGFQGTSVGLCREVQLSGDLREAGVIDGHDLPVDVVVTERGMFRA